MNLNIKPQHIRTVGENRGKFLWSWVGQNFLRYDTKITILNIRNGYIELDQN